LHARFLQATPFERMQWAALNNAIGLLGYWAAAAVVDSPRYGRRNLQVCRGVAPLLLTRSQAWAWTRYCRQTTQNQRKEGKR
jgi:hypothetical protein